MSKAVALVLVLVLALAILPTVAFAANGTVDSGGAYLQGDFSINLGNALTSTQVTIDANNGAGATYTTDVQLNSGFALPDRSGYNDGSFVLVSWNTESDGSGDSYEPGQTVTINEPAIFYAIRAVVHVTGLSLSDQSLQLTMGDPPTQLAAVVAPDYSSYPDVTWDSSDSTIATVDQTGLVTPKKGGIATITATADGINETCQVTIIQPATGISVDKSSISLIIGAKDTLKAAVSPIDATDTTVSWASDNPSVASVDQYGEIAAKAAGRAVITASVGSHTASCEVFVSSVMLGVQLAVNEKVFLYAIVAYSSPTSVWKTSNSAVATVDSSGLVTAVGEGKAVITVIADGVSQSVGIFVCPPASVAAPSSAKAGLASSDSVMVTWGTVTNAVVYEVWRAASASGAYTRIDTISTTSYTDTGLAAGSTFYYKIKACYVGSVNVYSDFSPAVSAGPMPVAPKNVKAISASTSSVTVTWESASGAVGYEVRRAVSPSGLYSIIATVSTTSYTNTGIAAGTTYYYKIRARYVGTSIVFSDYTATVYAGPMLSVPDSANAARASVASVKVIWGAVDGAAKYEVWRAATSSGAYKNVATVSETGYTDTGLAAGGIYYYKIRAYYIGPANVYSDFTSAVSAGPMPVTPGSVKAVSASVSSIAITWGSVAGAVSYEVWRASASGKYSLITAVSTTNYTNAGIAAGTTCFYKVRACYTGLSNIYSDYSTIVSAGPLLAVPEPAKAVRASISTIKVTWGTVAGAVKYEVWRANSVSGAYTIKATVSGTSYIDTGLAVGSIYYYKIRAYYISSVNVYSNFTSAVSAGPMPVTPGSVKAVSASVSSIAISWGAAAGAMGYEVWCAPSAAGTYTRVATVSTTSYMNMRLTAGTMYYYKIRAFYSGLTTIYSGYSAIVSAKPVPAAPVKVQSARASATSIAVMWGAVAGAAKYEIWRSATSNGNYTMAGETPTARFMDSGLKTGRVFYYRARAYCLVGNAKVYGAFSLVTSAQP